MVRVVERGADLDRRRVLVRRARLGDHGVDEQLATLGEVLRHLPHDRGAFGRRLAPHAVVEAAPSRADRLLDLRGRRGLDLGDRRLGRRVLDRERRPVTRHVLAVDERLAWLDECDHVSPSNPATAMNARRHGIRPP